MDNSLQVVFGNNWIFFGVASIVLCIISSAIKGNEATTSRLTKLVCGILDSVGQTFMVFAVIGIFFGKH